jgi:beta-glucosidase
MCGSFKDAGNSPRSFLWGSATSSYQVEGGIENNDWALAAMETQSRGNHSALSSTFFRAASPCVSSRVPFAGRSADHYHLYEKDFDLAASLSHNAHRFSLEWARIEPEEGKFNEEAIEHYRKVIQSLKKRNIIPFITLWHFTLPIWFAKMGGFKHKRSPEIFSRYCSFVIERLGNQSVFWITINEPIVWATDGYIWGKWPPFKKNIFSYKRVVKNLVKAHIVSYECIKKINPALQIGIAKNNIDFESNRNPLNKILSSALKRFKNFYFLNSIKDHQDFIGLNYYIHKKFGGKSKSSTSLPLSDMGWEIYPPGIYHCLLDLRKYKKPVYITENGIADALDTKRADFIKDSLEWVKRAMEEGVDIKGYFYWSLLDNFEWSYGFEKRFGLIEVNYDTMERKIRPSAYVYKKIIESNS